MALTVFCWGVARGARGGVAGGIAVTTGFLTKIDTHITLYHCYNGVMTPTIHAGTGPGAKGGAKGAMNSQNNVAS